MSRTRGEKVIAFIEGYCVVPEGELVGKPVKLADFQIKFILDIYDNPHVTDTAILSIARKNAKTGTIAFIVLAHTVGPEAKQNSRIISGAMSRDQAAEVYNLASKCVALSPKLREIVRPVPSSKKLIGLPMNVEYQAISAEGKTAHGKSPILAILDEVGQVVGPTSDFIDAITTAQGAYDNPLLIYISTQAATDADFFSIAIDDAKVNKPPKTVCHVYTADREDDEDVDVMDEDAWKASNPALGLFRSEKDMRKQADKAARMPSFENTFRNLNLNQRISSNSPFIARSTWEKCKAATAPIELCTEIYGGLDLSGRTDLSSFVLYGLHSGEWNVYPYFWTPEKGLRDRVKKDRAPYDLWVKQEFIRTTPGATIDYEHVAYEIGQICEEIDVIAIAFDRWRIEILKKELDRIDLELPLEAWGQGFKDMSPSLEALEGKILNSTLRHGDNPVLNMCAANAVVVSDPSGNRKLDKMKTSGRIDGVQALAMAAGIAEREHEPEEDPEDFYNNPIVIL